MQQKHCRATTVQRSTAYKVNLKKPSNIWNVLSFFMIYSQFERMIFLDTQIIILHKLPNNLAYVHKPEFSLTEIIFEGKTKPLLLSTMNRSLITSISWNPSSRTYSNVTYILFLWHPGHANFRTLIFCPDFQDAPFLWITLWTLTTKEFWRMQYRKC